VQMLDTEKIDNFGNGLQQRLTDAHLMERDRPQKKMLRK
jgi:hypothetical protein